MLPTNTVQVLNKTISSEWLIQASDQDLKSTTAKAREEKLLQDFQNKKAMAFIEVCRLVVLSRMVFITSLCPIQMRVSSQYRLSLGLALHSFCVARLQFHWCHVHFFSFVESTGCQNERYSLSKVQGEGCGIHTKANTVSRRAHDDLLHLL